jgi:hypothetical protein
MPKSGVRKLEILRLWKMIESDRMRIKSLNNQEKDENGTGRNEGSYFKLCY